jgi:isocitrate dehydrogenase (NAD+)
MLRHLGEERAANHIRAALAKVFTERKHLTRDVGGTASTTEFTDAMVEALHTIPPPEPVVKEPEM